jgi:DNA-binding Lrp family transcriptional regulator
VLECHHVTGEYDYLLKVAIRNRRDLERFAVERLTPIPGVARIHTSLALNEVKSTTALPLS